jgi:hypothetical protein
MRLAGIEKGGFYPYPPHMAEAIASWFIPLPAGTRERLLDPCAGEGEIATLLGKLLSCETSGCELFPYRAEKAAAQPGSPVTAMSGSQSLPCALVQQSS